MINVDRLREWEVYAYQLAFYVTEDERKAMRIAGNALIDVRFRLAKPLEADRVRAIIREAVLHHAVPVVCESLRGPDGQRNAGRSRQTKQA